MSDSAFPKPPEDKGELEEGDVFAPRFDGRGLITAVVTDARDGALLMVAHMNDEALRLTLDTGVAHFWSRSRGRLWMKGETSGNILRIAELRTDCDQDVLWLKVEVGGDGATCHTGRRSCFYRRLELSKGIARLIFDGEPL